MMVRIVVLLTVAALWASAPAQTPANPGPTPPDAPTPQPATKPISRGSPSDSYYAHLGVFCGSGASSSPAGTLPTAGCGAGFIFWPLPVFFEFGVMGPQANRSYLTGYITADTSIPLMRPVLHSQPYAIVGYSRLFETGHAFDYGLALALPRFGKPKDPSDSLRIELRDYWTFANPSQHNVMLRVGWMTWEYVD